MLSLRWKLRYGLWQPWRGDGFAWGLFSDRKLFWINLISFFVIGCLAGSIWAPVVLGFYAATTHLYITFLHGRLIPFERSVVYLFFLIGHVAVFLILQRSGKIGILNFENITNPGTLSCLVGFSFYMLQALSIATAVHREIIAPLSPLRYTLALSFCGAFLAGPLFNHDQLKRFHALKLRIPNIDNLYAELPILGGALLFKLVLANWLGQWVDIKEVVSPLGIIRSVSCFELQVYFDFAGYSLLSLFLCRIFGIPMYFNFRHPFASRDIPEFWRRWHIGLGTWFKENLFLPLKAQMNIPTVQKTLIPMVVFIASAAWHGPTRNFLVWGLFHGTAFVAAVTCLSKIRHRAIGRWISRFFMFVVIFLGRLFFMDSDSARLISKLNRLLDIGVLKGEFFEAIQRMPPLKSFLLGHWDDLTIALIVVGLIGYEVFAPRYWTDQPYQYFRRGSVLFVVFIAVFLFMQFPSQRGFVYGR